MKRCSQCEFIYEDDQSVCDMDGQALSYDSSFSTLSPSTALMRIAQPAQKTSSLYGVGLPAGVGLLMAILFSVGFYASADIVRPENESDAIQAVQVESARPPAQNSLQLSALAAIGGTSDVVDPITVNSNATVSDDLIQQAETVSETTRRAHTTQGDRRLSIARGLPPLPRLAPLPRLETAKPGAAKSTGGSIVTTSGRTPPKKVTNTDGVQSTKKDSRVGLFLKKTGRILSKPFKL